MRASEFLGRRVSRADLAEVDLERELGCRPAWTLPACSPALVTWSAASTGQATRPWPTRSRSSAGSKWSGWRCVRSAPSAESTLTGGLDGAVHRRPGRRWSRRPAGLLVVSRRPRPLPRHHRKRDRSRPHARAAAAAAFILDNCGGPCRSTTACSTPVLVDRYARERLLETREPSLPDEKVAATGRGGRGTQCRGCGTFSPRLRQGLRGCRSVSHRRGARSCLRAGRASRSLCP